MSSSVLPSRYLITPRTILSVSPVAADGLKQRQLIQLVILVVDHREACHLRMPLKPGANLIAARPLWHVGRDADKRNTPVFGTEGRAGRIVSPGRGQDHLRTSAIKKTFNLAKSRRSTTYGRLSVLAVFLQFKTPSMSRKITFIAFQRLFSVYRQCNWNLNAR